MQLFGGEWVLRVSVTSRCIYNVDFTLPFASDKRNYVTFPCLKNLIFVDTSHSISCELLLRNNVRFVH